MGERLSHRERKHRKRAAAATRRRFLIGGAAIGALSLAALAGNRLFSGSGDTDFAKFLNDLDRRTTGPNGADLLLEKAGEITERSFDQVGKYLDDKPTQVNGNVRFLRNKQELVQEMINDGACPNVPFGVVAATRLRENRPSWIAIATQPLSAKSATDIAESAIHEDLHLRTNTRDFRPEDMTSFLLGNVHYHTMDGLRAVFLKPGSTVGDPCGNDHHRYQLWEGCVQFSTLQIMLDSGIKLGNNGFNSQGYPAWTAAYTETVGKLFSGDHKSQLLLPALRSEPNIFFRNLGSRIDPRHNNPAFIGEQKTVAVFSRLPNS